MDNASRLGIDFHVDHQRSTTYRAVFGIFLVRNGSIDKEVDGLPTIRTLHGGWV
jgi:hypothetical protein